MRWTGKLTVAAAVGASQAQTDREDEVERPRLTMMRRYAEHTGCRRSFLLSYFGQDYPARAGTVTTTSPTRSPRRMTSRSRWAPAWSAGAGARVPCNVTTVIR